MSVAPGQPQRGSFGVVSAPRIGEKQRRSLVDEGQLTQKIREGLEADDFIVYGKASVEKYDEDHPPQKLEMSAFSDQMGPFLENGLISRRHKDIKVGEPLEEYTLEEATEVVVGDEVLEFDAGDTLTTGIEDDELWIVANLYNDSELARETRVGAMSGDLNGFSVTVFCKEWEETPKGQRVTDLDWHSVTIGGDEQIKNPDSRFGVAEFKGMFDAMSGPPGVTSKQAERAAVEVLRELPTNMSDTDSKGFWDRVSEIASQKSEEANGDGGGAPPEETKSEGDADAEEKAEGDEVEEKEGPPGTPEDLEEYDEEKDKSDADAVLEKVRAELGEEDARVLEKEMAGDEPPIEELEDEEPGDELKADPEAIGKALQEQGFVTEDRLEEKLESAMSDALTADDLSAKLDEAVPDDVATKSEVEEVMKAAEEVITETLPEAQKAAAEDAAEQTAEKMATGGTPDPAGGSEADEQDYMATIQSKFGSTGDA